MLQEIAAFGALTLDSLKTLRLTRDNRIIIAKAIGALFRELSELVTNGDKILRMLRSHNKGKTVDLDVLGQLLEDQHIIIRRINATLGKRKVNTALAIHAPQLSPLPVLLEGKCLRIELLRQRIEPVRRHFEIVSPLNLTRFGGPGRVKLPDDSSIDQSRRQLRKIRAQVEELREFIVQNFQVHEVL